MVHSSHGVQVQPPTYRLHESVAEDGVTDDELYSAQPVKSPRVFCDLHVPGIMALMQS